MSKESQSLRARLRPRVIGSGTLSARICQSFIQILIVLSIIAFTVETLPDLSSTARSTLRNFEVFVISVFTLEYLLRFWLSEKRVEFVFSFYGITDLLVILPFYLQLGLDLRSLRILWLFRLFRLFKLVRYVDAAKRIGDAFRLVRVDLAVFGMGALFVFYLAAVGIYFFERDAQPDTFASVIHSFWWALATLTTVGYGDVYPVTMGGKIFTFFTLMIGLGVFAVPTGLITMAIVSTREATLKDDAS
ncbi:ion transporter [Congregibacter sp.]|uniref:ion transporter n=1 Tax=Congregibacter sp. TaxID=2744308 RepID=UPI00385CBD8F